ncbi:MAG: DUF1127 domain-containing protein [Planctomycetales bacterium]|nr:DUF1127 domain-containing protein [Planctomycetales bacterium]MCC0025176.1 DUF1127 domain-containing protein [Hyphomicrobiaceae bacterium]
MTEHLHLAGVATASKPTRLHALRLAFARWIATAFKRWQRNRLISTMQGFDDRVLADIGVKRGEIAQAVDGILNDDRKAKELEIDNARLARSEEQLQAAA